MSGTHLKGTHEVVTKGGDPTIKGAFYCGVHTLRDHLMGTLQVGSSVGTRDASHWTKDPRSWVRISGEAKGTQWE